MTIPENNYGLDGFCVRADFLNAAGLPVGSAVRVDLPTDSPAFENLNGCFGTVVGAHFIQGVVAVKLNGHPSQEAAYFSPNHLSPL